MRLTQKQQPQLELEPAALAQLRGNVDTYQELKYQVALLTSAMEAEKATIREIMEEAHISSMSVNGCQLKIITGVTNTVDWKKLHGMGVTEAMKREATITKPKKSYLDIRGNTEPSEEDA